MTPSTGDDIEIRELVSCEIDASLLLMMLASLLLLSSGWTSNQKTDFFVASALKNSRFFSSQSPDSLDVLRLFKIKSIFVSMNETVFPNSILCFSHLSARCSVLYPVSDCPLLTDWSIFLRCLFQNLTLTLKYFKEKKKKVFHSIQDFRREEQDDGSSLVRRHGRRRTEKIIPS